MPAKCFSFITTLLLLCSTFVLYLEATSLYRLQHDLNVAVIRCNSTNKDACLEQLITSTRWTLIFNDIASRSAHELLLYIISSKNITQEEKEKMLWKLRQARYASRSFLRPEIISNTSPLLEQIDQALDLNTSRIDLVDVGDEPSHGFQFLAQFFFYTWTTSALLAIWKGCSRKIFPVAIRPLLFWLTVSIASFILWLVALAKV